MAGRRVKVKVAHPPHRMIRAVVDGWFVCAECGMAVVCPGCVEEPPGDVSFHLCVGHEYLQAVESFGHRLVWAVNESER